MRFDEGKLEKWANEIPECEEFLHNFFLSAQSDKVVSFLNYVLDIKMYSATQKRMKENAHRLLEAFEEIAQMKIYYG